MFSKENVKCSSTGHCREREQECTEVGNTREQKVTEKARTEVIGGAERAGAEVIGGAEKAVITDTNSLRIETIVRIREEVRGVQFL